MAIDAVEAARRSSRPVFDRNAMAIGYEGEAAAALVNLLRVLPNELRKNIALAVRDGARAVAEDARDLLSRTRAKGRRYKVGPLTAIIVGGANASSRPGEPPAQQSGELRRSLRVVKHRRDGLAYRIETEFYALFLEGGASGPGARRLDRRPFLSVALEQRRDMIEAILAEQIERALAAVQEGDAL
jgi:hypothetical protein